MSSVDELLTSEQRRLRALAYRMLGSLADAEDVVQEAFARLAAQDLAALDSPAAWLTTVTSRLCIDQLRSARRRRETYVGEWLPEPIDSSRLDPADAAVTGDSLTFAFLLLLDELSAPERVVFVLHEVFGHPLTEVAEMLGRSHAATRQLASRARRHVRAAVPDGGVGGVHPTDPATATAVIDELVAAVAAGAVERTVELLAPDVMFVSDGGGRALAVLHPQRGAARIARLLAQFGRTEEARTGAVQIVVTEVNAAPGIVVRVDGTVVAVMAVDVADGRVTAIRAVRNPEKLAAWQGDQQPDG